MSIYKQILDSQGEEAAKAYMRNLSQKARESGKPMGFAVMDKDTLKETASKGGNALWKKIREKNNDNRPSTSGQE